MRLPLPAISTCRKGRCDGSSRSVAGAQQTARSRRAGDHGADFRAALQDRRLGGRGAAAEPRCARRTLGERRGDGPVAGDQDAAGPHRSPDDALGAEVGARGRPLEQGTRNLRRTRTRPIPGPDSGERRGDRSMSESLSAAATLLERLVRLSTERGDGLYPTMLGRLETAARPAPTSDGNGRRGRTRAHLLAVGSGEGLMPPVADDVLVRIAEHRRAAGLSEPEDPWLRAKPDRLRQQRSLIMEDILLAVWRASAVRSRIRTDEKAEAPRHGRTVAGVRCPGGGSRVVTEAGTGDV